MQSEEHVGSKQKLFASKFFEMAALLEDSLINQSESKRRAIERLEESWHWTSKAIKEELGEPWY